MSDPRHDELRAHLIREHKVARRKARAEGVGWLFGLSLAAAFIAIAAGGLGKIFAAMVAFVCFAMLCGAIVAARDETKAIRILQTGLQRWGARTFSVIIVTAVAAAVVPKTVDYFSHRTPEQVIRDVKGWASQFDSYIHLRI